MKTYQKLIDEAFQHRGGGSPIYDDLSKSKLFLVDYDSMQNFANDNFDDHSNVIADVGECMVRGVNWNPGQQTSPFDHMFFEFKTPIVLKDCDEHGNEYEMKRKDSLNHLYAIEASIDGQFGKTVDRMMFRLRMWIKDSVKNVNEVTSGISSWDMLGFKDIITGISLFSMGFPCPDYPCSFCSKSVACEKESNDLCKKYPNKAFVNATALVRGKIESLSTCTVCSLPFVPIYENYKCSRLMYLAKTRKIFYQLLAYLNSPATIKTLKEYEPGYETLRSGERKRKPLPHPYYELRLARDTKTDQSLIKSKAGWNVSYCFDVRGHIRRLTNKITTVKSHKRGLKFINNAYIPKTYVIGDSPPSAVATPPTFLQRSVSFVRSIFQRIRSFAWNALTTHTPRPHTARQGRSPS